MKVPPPFVRSALILLLLLAGHGESADRRREELARQAELDAVRQELQLYQSRLEDVRVKRWQDKRNAIAAQEAFAEVWNDVKADLDRLAQAKNQKEESLLRLQNQETEKSRTLVEQEGRLKQFGLQIREKVLELDAEWNAGFPHQITDRLGRLAGLKKELEGGSAVSASALDALFGLAYDDFVLGETREITRDKLPVKGVAERDSGNHAALAAARLDPNSQARWVAGYRLRLGQAYQAFVSTESGDVAILGKTGRLDGKAWDWIEDLPEGVRRDLRKAVLDLVGGGSEGFALLPMDVLLTKATGEGFTAKSGHGLWESLRGEFRSGGWVMWLILSLAVAGLIIVMEKVIVFSRKDQAAGRLAARVQTLVEAGRIREAEALCAKSRGAVGKVLSAILECAQAGRADAESRAHEVMLHESPVLEKRITTMNILAAAAPLVGLLGTVTGMVSLFDVITVHGTGNPKLMAGGISEALIATKWGLGVAIPLLLSYNWLDNWSVRITANMEKHAARLLNVLFRSSVSAQEHA